MKVLGEEFRNCEFLTSQSLHTGKADEYGLVEFRRLQARLEELAFVTQSRAPFHRIYTVQREKDWTECENHP